MYTPVELSVMYPGSSCVLGLNIRHPPPGQTQQMPTVPSPCPRSVLCHSLSTPYQDGKSFSAAFKMFLMALLSNLTTPKQPWWGNWLAAKPQHPPSRAHSGHFNPFLQQSATSSAYLAPVLSWASSNSGHSNSIKTTCLDSADIRTMTSLIWWMQWGPETIFPRFTKFC